MKKTLLNSIWSIILMTLFLCVAVGGLLLYGIYMYSESLIACFLALLGSVLLAIGGLAFMSEANQIIFNEDYNSCEECSSIFKWKSVKKQIEYTDSGSMHISHRCPNCSAQII